MPIENSIDSVWTQIILFLLRLYNCLHKVFSFGVNNASHVYSAVSDSYKPKYYYYCRDSWIPYITTQRLTRDELPTLEWIFDPKELMYTYIPYSAEDTSSGGEGKRFSYLCVDIVKGGQGEEEEEQRACVIGHVQAIRWIGSEDPPSAEILVSTVCLLDGYWMDLEGLVLEVTENNGKVRRILLHQGKSTPLGEQEPVASGAAAVQFSA